MKRIYRIFVLLFAAVFFSPLYAEYKDIKPVVQYLYDLEGFVPDTKKAHVFDLAGKLSPEQIMKLDVTAKNLSNKYDCGVYYCLVNDFYRNMPDSKLNLLKESSEMYSFENYLSLPYISDDSAEDIIVFSDNFFLDNELGYTATRDTIMLVLDVFNRVYDVFIYGDNANNIFDSYGRSVLIDSFVPSIAGGKDDWNGAFETFLAELPDFFEAALSGKPVREPKKWWLITLIGGALGGIVGSGSANKEKRKLTSVKLEIQASSYLVKDSVKFSVREDMFSHTTESRRKIETSSSSSGSSHSYSSRSGGSSHSSGHF